MSPSQLKSILLLLNACVGIYIVVYLYATGGPIPGGDFPEEGIYLFHEKFAGSLFSAVQIAVIGAVALASAVAYHFRQASRECCFWLASAVAFFFFAFDEYFLIHENLDKWILHALQLPKNRLTDKLDDLIVLVYGLIALYILYKSWPWLRRHAGFIRNVKAGFACLLIMIFFDFSGTRFTPVKELEEDLFKIFAEAFFLLAYAAPLFAAKISPKLNPVLLDETSNF